MIFVLGAKYQQKFQIGQHETMSHGQKRVAEFMTRAMLRYWLWAVAFLSRNCYLGTCLDIDTLTTVFENHRKSLIQHYELRSYVYILSGQKFIKNAKK